MSHILTTHISQFHVLQLLPDPFIRVEIRSVGWQLLKMDISGSAFLHKLCHLFAMYRRAIPHDHQLTADLTPQMLKEPHTISAVKCSLAHQRVKISSHRDPTHHRQVIIFQKRLDDWPPSSRRIAPDQPRQQVETSLINKHNDQAIFQRLFFSEGQTSTRHFSIAASLRWLARSIGICGVHFNAFNNRDTCALWYATSNSSLMTWQTLQSWPRNPYASAPCDNRAGTSCSCC